MIEAFLTIYGFGMLAGMVGGARAPRFWLASVLSGTTAALGAAIVPLASGVPWEWRSTLAIGGEAVHLRLDAPHPFEQ